MKPTIIKAVQTVAVVIEHNVVLDSETVAAVRRFQSLIADRYNAKTVIVYGSKARGTHRQDSDADLAVLAALLAGEHQRFVSTKLAMADIA